MTAGRSGPDARREGAGVLGREGGFTAATGARTCTRVPAPSESERERASEREREREREREKERKREREKERDRECLMAALTATTVGRVIETEDTKIEGATNFTFIKEDHTMYNPQP